jgi:hypothetical protein
MSAKCIELAVAVPQVVAHRVARAALTGPIMSERDRREFQRMVSEKPAAFSQACWGMALQMWRANLELTLSMSRVFFTPFLLNPRSAASIAAQTQKAAMAVLGKGLAPVHRKAVLNAKRLSKSSPSIGI